MFYVFDWGNFTRALTEFLRDFFTEEVHLGRLAVDQHHVTRLAVPNKLHDALGVCVCAEGHVLDRHLHVHLDQTIKTTYSLETGYKSRIHLGTNLHIGFIWDYLSISFFTRNFLYDSICLQMLAKFERFQMTSEKNLVLVIFWYDYFETS